MSSTQLHTLQATPGTSTENFSVISTVGDDDRGSIARLGIDPEQHENVSSLPPVDHGKDAWLFIVGCFVVEAIIWGFPGSFGVFQKYYSTKSEFSSNGNIAAIGTSASGLMYLSAPIIMAILGRYPILARPCMVVGFIITIAMLITASFAQSVTTLILTQGMGYAIGGGLVYSPAMLYMDEWFVYKKGLATGIMWAGSGVAGVVLPLVLDICLGKWGFRTVLRAWAVVVLLFAPIILFTVKPRLPIARESGPRRISLDFLTKSTFWWYQTANIIEGLGFFLPGIYLPTYASSIGINNVISTLTLSLLNLTSVFGQIIFGSLSDRLAPHNVTLISAIGSTLSVFLLWGFSVSPPVLVVFVLLYGFFAGGFTSTWTGSINHVVREHPTEKGFVFGLMAAGRGVGNVIAGPLSIQLLKAGGRGGSGGFAYGSSYVDLIVFTGVTSAFGALGWVAMGPPGKFLNKAKFMKAH